MALLLVTHRQEAATILDVAGDVDVDTAPELRAALNEIIDADGVGGVVVDLTGTDFIDSSALGVLVGANKRLANKDATLTVVCTKPHLLKVFEITRLDAVIPIVSSVEAAFAKSS